MPPEREPILFAEPDKAYALLSAAVDQGVAQVRADSVGRDPLDHWAMISATLRASHRDRSGAIRHLTGLMVAAWCRHAVTQGMTAHDNPHYTAMRDLVVLPVDVPQFLAEPVRHWQTLCELIYARQERAYPVEILSRFCMTTAGLMIELASAPEEHPEPESFALTGGLLSAYHSQALVRVTYWVRGATGVDVVHEGWINRPAWTGMAQAIRDQQQPLHLDAGLAAAAMIAVYVEPRPVPLVDGWAKVKNAAAVDLGALLGPAGDDAADWQRLAAALHANTAPMAPDEAAQTLALLAAAPILQLANIQPAADEGTS